MDLIHPLREGAGQNVRCWFAIRPEHIELAPRGAADRALLTGIVERVAF
jgi:hypothetical protein